MFRLSRIVTLTMILALVGCTEAMGPSVHNLAVPGLNAGKGKGGGGGSEGGPETHVVRQDSGAPMLESYTVSFWAVKGQDRTVEIWYQEDDSGGQYKQQNRFFQFEVSKHALETSPLGVPYARGDSVLITATVHPINFDIEFQPSGIVFSHQHPARLKVWYGIADHDFNQDGVSDATDQKIMRQLSLFHHEGPLTEWSKIKSTNDTFEMTVEADIKHFSGYAVSW